MSSAYDARIDAYLDSLVEAGRYPSREAARAEAYRLLIEREQELDALRASIEQSLADVRAGRTYPIEEAFDRVRDGIRRKYGLDAA